MLIFRRSKWKLLYLQLLRSTSTSICAAFTVRGLNKQTQVPTWSAISPLKHSRLASNPQKYSAGLDQYAAAAFIVATSSVRQIYYNFGDARAWNPSDPWYKLWEREADSVPKGFTESWLSSSGEVSSRRAGRSIKGNRTFSTTFHYQPTILSIIDRNCIWLAGLWLCSAIYKWYIQTAYCPLVPKPIHCSCQRNFDDYMPKFCISNQDGATNLTWRPTSKLHLATGV